MRGITITTRVCKFVTCDALKRELCWWEGPGHCVGGDSASIGSDLAGQPLDQLSAIGREVTTFLQGRNLGCFESLFFEVELSCDFSLETG